MIISLFGSFCLLLILNAASIRCILNIDNIKINKYYLGSSKIYHANHRPKVFKRDVPVSTRPEFLFDLKLYNDGKPFTIYIRQRDSDILADEPIFLKISNLSDSGYGSIPIDLRTHSNLYEGYITDIPDNSSVSGYVKDNNFYGHLIVNNTVYYIDELKDFWNLNLSNGTIAERNALIFQRDSVTIGMLLGETKSAKMLFQELIKQNYYYKRFQKWKQKGMLCPMVIVIDNSFLTVVHNSNIEAAVFQVLFSLEEANAVFRSTDFDGDGIPDNIGFYVKKIVVITTKDPVYFIPEYQPKAVVQVSDYLIKFMRYNELARHCVGILFTAQKFETATLGASYTPDSSSLHPTSGICDDYIGNFGTMNGLVITASTIRTALVNQVVFEVTIIHELGHSFGSSHDTDPKCFGHVMSPKSFADYYGNRTHLVFSPCSREHIMRTLVMKGDCFEPVVTSFCGNSIVEDDEDCDCGITRDCLVKDPCCVPRRTKEYPCKINKKGGFQCHPSQGQCCTKDCRYRTRLETFVNCKHFDQRCPCANNTTNCSCGLNGMCINDQCHSVECARLQLNECQCSDKTLDKFCQVCCQYENNCVSAQEATNRVLSSAQNKDVLQDTIFSEHTGPLYKSKQFVFKMFCLADRCASLPFLQGKVGEYCLHKGKLGKCQAGSRCQIFQSEQSFPSFESASGKFKFNLISAFCYLFLNSFLINMF